jgi:copper homeostasis protein (lipoprotein)
MNFRIVSAGFLLAAALASATAMQAKTVTLISADNRTDVSLNLGDTLVVELEAGTVPQFRWVSHLPKNSGLTLLNEGVEPAKKGSKAPQISRYRFNAATTGDVTLPFSFETAVKTPGAAPQDTSAFSVRVHIASGAPRDEAAILLGVYKGTLPCGDCSGLDTTLRLYAKGKFDMTYAFYVRTQTYRGAPHGDLTLTDRGRWFQSRGTEADPDANVYELEGEDKQHSESLLVQQNGNALTQLSREQKPSQTKMNFTLRRVAQSQ